MNKRLLSILLIFTIIFGLLPTNMEFHSNANESNRKIRVRVEGKLETLYDGEVTVTDEVYGIDLLKTAVGEENIGGQESSYGFYIEEILGEKPSGDAYWGIYVVEDGEIKRAEKGISELTLEGIEELIFHVNKDTWIPILEYEQDGREIVFTLKAEKITYDDEWNETKTIEIVEDAVLEIEGQEYRTDEKGQVRVELSNGEHEVKVRKEREGDYPELIRTYFNINISYPYEGEEIKVRVEGKEGQLYCENITVSWENTAYDLLKTAVGEENIGGQESSYGFYIEEILGEKPSGGAYWGIYVVEDGKIKSANKGISELTLEGIEELIFHVNKDTWIPILEYEQDGRETVFTVKSYDDFNDKIIDTVEGAVVEIEGQEYRTDENGQVRVELSRGEYEVKVSKEREGDYPELIRTYFNINISYPYEGQKIKVRVEGKEGQLYCENITVSWENTAYDLLKTAVGEENIGGQESSYGFYIEEILGEKPSDGAYWGIYVVEDGEIKRAEKGISELTLEGIEELIFHVNKDTWIPILEYEQDGREIVFTLKAEKITYDDEWNETKTIEIVEDAVLEIEGQEYRTDEKGQVRVELSKGEHEVKVRKEREGDYPELIRTYFKIMIGSQRKIEIVENQHNIKKGENLKLTAIVTDEDGNVLADELIRWESSNPQVVRVDEETGLIEGLSPGRAIIKAILIDDESIFDSIEITVEEIDIRTNFEVINDTLMELKEYYAKKDNFTYREAIGYYHLRDNDAEIEIIKSKFSPKTTMNMASDYASNIIGVLAIGEDPTNYSGNDYVNSLKDLQRENGVFEVNGEGIYPTQTAYSVIALDMSQADYDREGAIGALLNLQKSSGYFGDVVSIDSTAMTIMALQNHRDIEGVNEAIDRAVDFLLSETESMIETGNQYTISAVIQGLIAVGENPLSDKWKVNDKTLLNALLKYKGDNLFDNDFAREQIFTALADLYKRESMFTKAKINDEGFNDYFTPIEDENGDDDLPPDIPDVPDSGKVYITIEGYKGETILSRTAVDIEKGDTVMDILRRVLDREGIDYKLDRGRYVKSIDGLEEFEYGAKSGWMFKVNGEFPGNGTLGATEVYVEDGDRIEWIYTTTLGEAEGAPKYNDEDSIDEIIDEAEEVLDDKGATEEELDEVLEGLISVLDDLEDEDKDIDEVHDTIRKVVNRIIDKIGQVGVKSKEIKENRATLQFKKEDLVNTAKKFIKKVEDLEEDLNKNNINFDKKIEKKIVIDVEGVKAEKIEGIFPEDSLKEAFDRGLDKIEFKTEIASLSIDRNSLDDYSLRQEMKVHIERINKSDLDESIRENIPVEIIMDINLTMGHKTINKFNRAIEISLPYDGNHKNKEELTVFYIKDDGSIEPVGGIYREETGNIKFMTNHLSKYFVKPATKDFQDIDNIQWAETPIKIMAGKGYINGRGNGEFSPYSNISRAEFVAIITRILKYEAPEGIPLPFEDVDSDDWYYNAVSAAYYNNLIKGITEKHFNPDGYITRQEIAKVIGNVLYNQGYNKVSDSILEKFDDSGIIDDWAMEGAAIAAKYDIINGVDNRFNSTAKATRAEAAVMLYRLLKLI